MNTHAQELTSVKRQINRNVLWIASFILLIVSFIFVFAIKESVGLILLLFLLGILVYLMYTSKKFYNWLMPLFILFFVGIFFKRNHWPGAGIIFVISTTLIATELYLFSIKVFTILKHNSFVKWLGFASSMVLAVTMLTLLFRLMHWPLPIPFSILNHIISLSLITITFILIIKLPGINFSTWLPIDRKVFYRVIIMPLVIVFSLSILSNVYPSTFQKLIFKTEKNPWNLDEIKLKPLEGIK